MKKYYFELKLIFTVEKLSDIIEQKNQLDPSKINSKNIHSTIQHEKA